MSLAGAERQGNEKMGLIASFEKPRPLQTLPKAACANVCILVTSATEPDAFRNPHKGRRASSCSARRLLVPHQDDLPHSPDVRGSGSSSEIQRRASAQSCPSPCCGLQRAWVPVRGRCVARREDGATGPRVPSLDIPGPAPSAPLSAVLRSQAESFFQFASM